MRVVGYTYDADIHCPDCTTKYIKENSDSDFPDVEAVLIGDVDFEDSEGNPIHPIFDTSETDCPEHCSGSDCNEYIDTSWTGEAVNYAVQALEYYIAESMRGANIKGDAETLDTWRDELTWCTTDARDELVIKLYETVREEERLASE